MHNPGDFNNLSQKQTSRRIKHVTTSPKQTEARRLRGVQSQDFSDSENVCIYITMETEVKKDKRKEKTWVATNNQEHLNSQ